MRRFVSIWRLPDAEAECHLVDRLERLEGIQTAKAICWASRALPPFAEGELLSVLLSDRVLLIPVLPTDGTFSLQPAMVLQIGFPMPLFVLVQRWVPIAGGWQRATSLLRLEGWCGW